MGEGPGGRMLMAGAFSGMCGVLRNTSHLT